MKSSEQLKKELHEYIDSIDDEKTLLMVHEEVVDYLKTDAAKNEEEALTEEQIQEFNKIVKEMENGEFVTMDDFKKTMGKWLTK